MQDFQLDTTGFTAPKRQPHEERLTIALLMLWTATTAVVLGFDRATNVQSNGQLGQLPRVMSFITSPLIGMGLSAWALMLWRWFTDGPRFPTQPGHWLLLLFGFTSVTSLVLRAVMLISLAGLRGFQWFVGIYFLTELSAVVMYVVAIRSIRDRWRWLFIIGLVTSAIGLASSVLMLASYEMMMVISVIRQLLGWGFCLGMCGIAIADIRDATRRDSLHWIGLGVVGGYLLYATAAPWLIRWLT